MDWENYGKEGWEIDHIIPVSYFVKNDLDIRDCNNFRNLQPLWRADNNKKRAKLPENIEILLNKIRHNGICEKI